MLAVVVCTGGKRAKTKHQRARARLCASALESTRMLHARIVHKRDQMRQHNHNRCQHAFASHPSMHAWAIADEKCPCQLTTDQRMQPSSHRRQRKQHVAQVCCPPLCNNYSTSKVNPCNATCETTWQLEHSQFAALRCMACTATPSSRKPRSPNGVKL